MNKTVKVEFTESSKSVNAMTKVEYTGEDIPTNDEIRSEAEKLYDEASKYSATKTMQKR